MVLNAANEVAVEAFLDGRLGFTSIPVVIELTMNAHAVGGVSTLRDRAQRSIPGRATYARDAAGELELTV